MRCFLACLALSVLLLDASTSFAKDVIELVRLEGRQSAVIQKSIRQSLRSKGYKVPLVDARGDEPDAIASVTADVSKVKRGWVLNIQIWSGDGDEAIMKTSFKARRPKILPRLVRRMLWKRSKQALALAAESPSTEPDSFEDEETAGDDEPAQPIADREQVRDDGPTEIASSSSSKEGRSIYMAGASVSLGPRIFRREFGYKDDIFKSLDTYEAPGAAALVLEAEYNFTDAIGITGRYVNTPKFNSNLDGNTENYSQTTSMSFELGGRYSIPIGKHAFEVSTAYGGHNFTIKSATGPKPAIPNVRFRYLRAGAGTEVGIAPSLKLRAEAGYRYILSAGEIESPAYFPKLDVAAVDARVSLRIALWSAWQVELATTMQRFFFSMNSSPGDTMVAGGAIDQYLGGQLLLRYSLE